MAEILLLLAVVAAPVLIGVATAYLARPWWWGALVAVALFWIAAIAPEPEERESRLRAGDLVFLIVVSLFVAGLTWLGAWGGRRWLRRARA